MRNIQKFCDTAHTRQAMAQPKKSPSMVVNLRPSLSVRMPPQKAMTICTAMVTERISPICTSVTPKVYM